MRKSIFALMLASIIAPALAQSALAPFPPFWSFQDVASWSLPRVKLVPALPDVSDARAGDLVLLTNEPTPLLYRNSGSGWSLVGSNGSESAGSGEFFRFMNVATNPYSVPVIGRAGSWTAAPFAKVGTFGASLSDSPLYFSPTTGEVGAVIASASRFPVTRLANGYLPSSAYVENFDAMFDGNYSTFATHWYDPAGGALGYPSVYANWTIGSDFMRVEVGSFTAVAFMLNNDQSIIPASISVRYYDGTVHNLWSTNGAAAGLGRWVVSATFTPSVWGQYITFQPNSTVATNPWGYRWRRVEIAELRFLDAAATEPGVIFGPDSCPQVVPLLTPDTSSTTFDALTIRGQTATPTGRVPGTMWLDINLSPPRLKVWSGTAWTSL